MQRRDMSPNVYPKDEQHKPPKNEYLQKNSHQRLTVVPLSIDDMQRHSPLMLSPRFHSGSAVHPMGGSHHGKPNCLCSPTTHTGSFRCRFHRGSGSGLSRAHHSVEANLSELANKSPSSIVALNKRPVACSFQSTAAKTKSINRDCQC
ncbi:uncharacterized protein LOC116213125 [Punica granatum]|uniref:Uncharacterized protein LOC116213125 n=1 Tax=Punica granatum TaxID=22663 RepID=A0A6P8E1P4_PUNGR|nr:uncharacterized protein LOC116213125 [Punica granatum]